jgi:hypothetical protein
VAVLFDVGTGKHSVDDRVEYWWVSSNADIQPAEVTFRGGIPIHIRLIGSRDILAAAAVELLERLPAAPRPVLERTEVIVPPARSRSIRLIWLIGMIALILIYWFSGQLFDVLK